MVYGEICVLMKSSSMDKMKPKLYVDSWDSALMVLYCLVHQYKLIKCPLQFILGTKLFLFYEEMRLGGESVVHSDRVQCNGTEESLAECTIESVPRGCVSPQSWYILCLRKYFVTEVLQYNFIMTLM